MVEYASDCAAIILFFLLTCERPESNVLRHVHSDDHILVGVVLMEVTDPDEHAIAWSTPGGGKW